MADLAAGIRNLLAVRAKYFKCNVKPAGLVRRVFDFGDISRRFDGFLLDDFSLPFQRVAELFADGRLAIFLQLVGERDGFAAFGDAVGRRHGRLQKIGAVCGDGFAGR